MRSWIIVAIAGCALGLLACGGPESFEEPVQNADGQTYFCDACGADVAWPPQGHAHGETSFCADCGVRTGTSGHVHRENRWCDECGVVAVWVDEDAKDDWPLRGHHHGRTAWCDVCKADVSRAAAAEAGGHHHLYTAFCPDDACGIDVTRRWTSDGSAPVDPPELVADHVHGKSTFCPTCRTEVEKDPETGRPSRNHIHQLTRYSAESQAEVAARGHEHGVTAFCHVCLSEVPLSPGVPTGALRGPTSLTSPASLLGEEIHRKANEELALQAELAKELKDALVATEAKLGIPEQPMVHAHDYPHDRPGGSREILGADPVSRLRNYEEGAPEESVAERVNQRIDDIQKARYISRADVIRNAVDRLRGQASLTEQQEAELRFWEDLEKTLGNGGQ